MIDTHEAIKFVAAYVTGLSTGFIIAWICGVAWARSDMTRWLRSILKGWKR